MHGQLLAPPWSEPARRQFETPAFWSRNVADGEFQHKRVSSSDLGESSSSLRVESAREGATHLTNPSPILAFRAAVVATDAMSDNTETDRSRGVPILAIPT